MAPKPKKSKSKRKKRKPKTETIKQTQKVTQTVTIVLPEKSKRKRKRTVKKSAVQVQQRSTYPVVQFQPQQPFQQPPQPPLDRLNPIAINHRANLPAGIFNRPVQAQRQPFREMDTMSELTDEYQPIGQYLGEVPSTEAGLSVDFYQPGDELSRDSLVGEPIPGILGLEPDELESLAETVEFYQPGDERSFRIREQEKQEDLAGSASTISLTESGFERELKPKPPRQRRRDAGYPRPHVVERNRNAKEIRRLIEEERRSLEENDRRMRDERRQQERELGDDITEIRTLVDSGSESGSAI